MDFILDRYIARKFMGTFGFVIGIFVVITIVFDISEKIDEFLETGVPFQAIVFDYYFNFIPYIFNVISPLFTFIAALYFTSRLAYNSEIVAILSSGVSFYRMMLPYFLVATLLTGVDLYLKNWLIPQNNKGLRKFEDKYLKDPYRHDERNIHLQLEPGEFLYFQSYNSLDSVGHRAALEFFDSTRLQRKLLAERMQWSGEKSMWKAINYRERIRKAEGEGWRIEEGDTMLLDLRLHPRDFGRRHLNVRAMTTPRLSEYIRYSRVRGDPMLNYFLIEKYNRFALPFANYVLIMIAVAVSSRKVRGGMGAHLALGIGIAVTYIVAMRFSSTFSINAGLPPWLAVWVPNTIYLVGGLFLIRRAPK
jgi:lipopolysaccharide export system permease protein